MQVIVSLRGAQRQSNLMLKARWLRALRSLAMIIYFLLSAFDLPVPAAASAAENTGFSFQSLSTQNTLMEFYTAETLKNCNSAEAWLSRFKDSPLCFNQVIPVVFHLSRWDDRNWKDPFALLESTARFVTYTRLWNARGIYAPTAVLNGTEWNGWSREQEPPESGRKVGVLSVTGKSSAEISISFSPRNQEAREWTAHAALLGCAMESKVPRGENANKVFVHEFVALSYQSEVMQKSDAANWTATVKFKPSTRSVSKQQAVAVWVTQEKILLPVQAIGGYLPEPKSARKSS